MNFTDWLDTVLRGDVTAAAGPQTVILVMLPAMYVLLGRAGRLPAAAEPEA